MKKLLSHQPIGGADAAHRAAQIGRRLNVSIGFKIIISVCFSCRSCGH